MEWILFMVLLAAVPITLQNEDTFHNVQLCTSESMVSTAALFCHVGIIHIHKVMYNTLDKTSCRFLIRKDGCRTETVDRNIIGQCELMKECLVQISSVWLDECNAQSTHMLIVYKCTDSQNQVQCVCGKNCSGPINNPESITVYEQDSTPAGTLDYNNPDYYQYDYSGNPSDQYDYYFNDQMGRQSNRGGNQDEDYDQDDQVGDDDSDDSDDSDDDDSDDSDDDDEPKESQRKGRQPRSPRKRPRRGPSSRQPRSSRETSPYPGRITQGPQPDQNNYEGFIASPNFPHSYPSDAECACILQSERKANIVLEALHFQLEDGHDFLAIQGSGTAMTLTGEEFKRKAIFTDSITLHFSTDDSIDGIGFLLHYKALDVDQTPVQILAFCGTDFSELQRRAEAADFGTGKRGPSSSPFTMTFPGTHPTKTPEASTTSKDGKSASGGSIQKYFVIGGAVAGAVLLLIIITIISICICKYKCNQEPSPPIMSLSELHKQKALKVADPTTEKGAVYEDLQPNEDPLPIYENPAFQEYASQNHDYTGLAVMPTAPVIPPPHQRWETRSNPPDYESTPEYSTIVYDQHNGYLSPVHGDYPPPYFQPI